MNTPAEYPLLKELDILIAAQGKLMFQREGFDEAAATAYGVALLDFMRERGVELRGIVAAASAGATSPPSQGGWLVIAHGESERAEAFACSTRAQVETAFTRAMFGSSEPQDIEADEIAECMAKFDNLDYWNNAGVMDSIEFEIGGIDVYSVFRLPIVGASA